MPKAKTQTKRRTLLLDDDARKLLRAAIDEHGGQTAAVRIVLARHPDTRLSQPNLAAFLAGTKNPPPVTLAHVCGVVGLDFDYFPPRCTLRRAKGK